MKQESLGERIAYCRKEKGLSQEKVAEYLEVSRQAVTKWENDVSKPTTENLIRLAELFSISLDEILENGKVTTKPYKNSQKPWIFIGVSILFIIIYCILGNKTNHFDIGTCICLFIICIPIQLFLHVFFSNAIESEQFNMLAGYNEKIEYNRDVLKKLLTQIDIQIGIMSTVYIFFLMILSLSGIGQNIVNGIGILLYTFHMLVVIIFTNYRMGDKLYVHKEDYLKSIKGYIAIVLYVLVIFVGIGLTIYLFSTRHIENNSVPAIKLALLMIGGIISATSGYFIENHYINKSDVNMPYKVSQAYLICLGISSVLYILMCIV